MLLVQVVLSALTVYVVYLLASRMWSAPIGLLAAVLTVLDPLQNASTATLLTECLAVLALTTFAAVGYAVFTNDKPRRCWRCSASCSRRQPCCARSRITSRCSW